MQKKNKKKTTWRKMKKKILLFCLSIYLFILSSRWFVPILDCEVKTRGRLSLFDPKESRNRAQLVGRTINSLVPKEKQNNKKKKKRNWWIMRRGKESKQIRLLLQFVNQFATSKSTWTYTTTLTPSELFVFNQKLKSICQAAKQKLWLAHLTLLGVIIIMRIVDIIIIYSIRLSSSPVSNT